MYFPSPGSYSAFFRIDVGDYGEAAGEFGNEPELHQIPGCRFGEYIVHPGAAAGVGAGVEPYA